jgi:predicted RNase H-like HicB family nuclease
MTYHFAVYAGKNGFWAECRELPGCVSEGNTKDELRTNLWESLNLYLEEPIDSTVVFALPNESLDVDKKLMAIEVEPEIAFAVMLRHIRLNHRITQREAAAMLGMKNVYSYQRLEKRSNPTLSLMKKIKSVFPEMRFESIL